MDSMVVPAVTAGDERLRARIQPVVEASLPCHGGPNCKCEAIERAAMLCVAEAVAEALRGVGCKQRRINLNDCRTAFKDDPPAIFWCQRCQALVAAEAQVARLKEEGQHGVSV